jgi:hypothetical protein
MESKTNKVTRFLRFLKGEGAQDDRTQIKRFLTIFGLAVLVAALLMPIVVLASQPRGNGQGGEVGVTTPIPGLTPSAPTQPTVVAGTATPPLVKGPIKGMTDNPAYQWWRWPNHPQPDSWWGTDQDAQTLGTQISLMQQLGVKLFRVELPWPFVAPSEPGGASYDSAMARDPNWSGYQWDRMDLIVRLATLGGLQLVVQAVYSPDWASGVTATINGGPNNPPQSAQYFGDFMFAAATRYKGQIHYWEMWNEPDYPAHTWNGTLQQYVNLVLQPGYEAVKKVDATAKVLLGGLQSDPNMAKMYAAGAEPYFDIGNFHAYLPAAGGVAATMDHVRAAMNQNGDKTKPLWMTEFGYETPDSKSETNQARLIHDVYNGLTSLQAILFYQLHDTSVYDADGSVVKQVHWGVVSQDFSRQKPGFAAFQQAVGGSLPSLALGNAATATGASVTGAGPLLQPGALEGAFDREQRLLRRVARAL